MSTDYPRRVRENILPLSLENNLPKAFREWYFTEEIFDHVQPTEICQLCDKEELRYHFQIKNENNGNMLWVGSKCILKFGLSVYDNEGDLLDEQGARKKLNSLTKKMQLESCIKALEELSRSENNDILKRALDYYKNNKRLTPKLAFVVFWRMKKHRIDHHPSFFKISLKRHSHQQDLAEMQTDRVHMFWKALSPSQKKLAEDLGHSPPNS